MAAIDFPSLPSVNDVYTVGDRSWKFVGDGIWESVTQPGPTGPTGDTGPIGPTGPTGQTTDFPSTAVSSNITLISGNKYFVDTTAARTLTLPASPVLGDEIQILDAAGTAETYNITVQNNSNKINGLTDYAVLNVNGVGAVFVYTGSTYGWRLG